MKWDLLSMYNVNRVKSSAHQMAIKTTSIRDVFKNKVKDLTRVPTIWIDPDDVKHEDWTHLIVGATPNIKGISMSTYETPLNSPGYESPVPRLYFQGSLLQVGSHVLEVQIFTSREKEYSSEELRDLFKYATSLNTLSDSYWGTVLRELPEDMFSNCPELMMLYEAFSGHPIETIPENLFANNPKLKILSHAFHGCRLTEIPPKLFANNPELESLSSAFRATQITTIPKELFDPFRNTGEEIYLDETFADCDNLRDIPVGLFKGLDKDSSFYKVLTDTPFLDQYDFDNDPGYKNFISTYFPDWVTTEDAQHSIIDGYL